MTTAGIVIVITSIVLATLVARRISWAANRRALATLLGSLLGVVALLATGATPASAAIVTAVPLGSTANFSVLAGSAVTNTNGSVLASSLGVYPGSSVTGFPPGQVTAPATIEDTTPTALAAQTDLTAGYVYAQAQPITAEIPANLSDQDLGAGIYSAKDHGALDLPTTITLDGAGDPTSVFIFQTDSTLTTASSSTVVLTNGAQECNVFWQVGSSATLGGSSVFRGTILAQTAVTVGNSATIHGRTLARDAAVTLDDDSFVNPTCDTTSTGPTTTTVAPPTTVAPTTIPPTTTPPSTVPPTTVPPTTVPVTTIPPTTVPATTIPATTIPATTVPATTIPSSPTTVPVGGTTTTVVATTIPAAPTTTAPVLATTTTGPSTSLPRRDITTTTVRVEAPTTTQPTQTSSHTDRSGTTTTTTGTGTGTGSGTPTTGGTTSTVPTVVAFPRTGGAALRPPTLPGSSPIRNIALAGFGGSAVLSGLVLLRRGRIDASLR